MAPLTIPSCTRIRAMVESMLQPQESCKGNDGQRGFYEDSHASADPQADKAEVGRRNWRAHARDDGTPCGDFYAPRAHVTRRQVAYCTTCQPPSSMVTSTAARWSTPM